MGFDQHALYGWIPALPPFTLLCQPLFPLQLNCHLFQEGLFGLSLLNPLGALRSSLCSSWHEAIHPDLRGTPGSWRTPSLTVCVRTQAPCLVLLHILPPGLSTVLGTQYRLHKSIDNE